MGSITIHVQIAKSYRHPIIVRSRGRRVRMIVARALGVVSWCNARSGGLRVALRAFFAVTAAKVLLSGRRARIGDFVA